MGIFIKMYWKNKCQVLWSYFLGGKKWSLSKTDEVFIKMWTAFDPVGFWKILMAYVGFSEFSTKKRVLFM